MTFARLMDRQAGSRGSASLARHAHRHVDTPPRSSSSTAGFFNRARFRR